MCKVTQLVNSRAEVANVFVVFMSLRFPSVIHRELSSPFAGPLSLREQLLCNHSESVLLKQCSRYGFLSVNVISFLWLFKVYISFSSPLEWELPGLQFLLSFLKATNLGVVSINVG